MNAFELFGLKPSLNLEEACLAERFAHLRANFHPDRFSQASALERRLAVQRAAAINDAYAILHDPLRRAQHLLELRGMVMDDAATVQDPEFLMQQLTLREALEEAQDEHARARLQKEVERLWRETWSSLAEALEVDALAEAQRLFQRLQFLARFLKQLSR